MLENIFSKMNIPQFSRLLDASAAQQRAIAENISNIETPGYKAQEVDFKRLLKEQTSKTVEGLRVTESRHIGGTQQENSIPIHHDNSAELISSENNVDVDKEMVKSAQNQLYYSATSKIIADKFKALHNCIRGRVG